MTFLLRQLHSFPELDEYRFEVRGWLAANTPVDWRNTVQTASEEQYLAFERDWLATLHRAGYAVPHWPAEYGGSNASLSERIVLIEEIVSADAPQPHQHRVALNHVAETLIAHGTEEHRRIFLPRIVEGEIWCQGFSEPEAGSDLASLRTRAQRDGDHYRVNGQKIWSSYAKHARWCLLLARTDPHAPKRAGLSMLLLDLHSDGVDIRPIKQISGETEFCEIFLNDVSVPADFLVGGENDGWRTAQTTLATERGVGVVGLQQQLSKLFEFLVSTAKDVPSATADRALDDPAVQHRLIALYSEIIILRRMCRRMLQELNDTGAAGPQSSIIKLFYSELLQRATEFGVELGGLDAQQNSVALQGASWTSGIWMIDHLKSWAWTIGGGTSEIQRNMISERTLMLPREPFPEAQRPGGGSN
jgi:alkylation response protein AidB-like acyl-CoA dehydrogenase